MVVDHENLSDFVFAWFKTSQSLKFSMGPLQPASHSRGTKPPCWRAKVPRDETNKENYHFKFCMSFVYLVPVRLLLSQHGGFVSRECLAAKGLFKAKRTKIQYVKIRFFSIYTNFTRFFMRVKLALIKKRPWHEMLKASMVFLDASLLWTLKLTPPPPSSPLPSPPPSLPFPILP